MNKAKELFLHAVERLEPAQWDAYLTDACEGDETLRDNVARLLVAHQAPDSLLQGVKQVYASLAAERVGSMVGRYKLLKEIGEGGFANVYLAEQTEPVRRRVAVKILKLGMDTREIITRFEIERQALALMDHPHIARVIDGGATKEGRPYFVMEYIDGQPITNYCDEHRLGVNERLDLFIAVTRAVQHAHQKGIVHRDIKPSNVLVTAAEDRPIPKIIDFGIAKLVDQDLADKTLVTRQGQFIGTPQYISPEQAESRGVGVDTRSDIYSLGVLLYELLTGFPPFPPRRLQSANLAELIRVIQEEHPQRPSQRLNTEIESRNSARSSSLRCASTVRALQGDLDWIVLKAMEKDPERRFATAAEFADDVVRYLNVEAVIARPPSLGYQVNKLVRRHKIGLVTGSAFAVVLIAAAVLSIGMARAARTEARRANSTLAELRSSAPAFMTEARALVVKERFNEALAKVDYAIRLQPQNVEYVSTKAGLLECQLKFAEAATVYREALRLDPENALARIHRRKCEQLVSKMGDSENGYSLRLLADLHELMQKEQRSAAELLPIARILGDEQNHLLDYWLERLESLPITGKRPLEERLSVSASGVFTLDLSHTQTRDLSELVDMPIESLNLSDCLQLTTIEPLATLPLKSLDLARTSIRDLSPLKHIQALEDVNLSGTDVHSLEPLSGLPLERLLLHRCPVDDLAPLKGMPLEELDLGYTRANSLEPLRGMPLRVLNVSYTPASDVRVLRGAPLERLLLQGTDVGYLAFLRGMPLRELSLWGCNNAHTFSVLGAIETLEVLLLPSNCVNSLSETDRAAIDALQQHAHLTQVSDRLPANGRLTSIKQGKEFWPEWNRKRALQKRLLKSGITCLITSDEPNTWDIEVTTAAFDDLSVLAGEPVRELNINGTRVSDLAPLRDMSSLQTLWAGSTPITNVEPLRGSNIARLSLASTGVTDIQPLAGVPQLRQLWIGNTKIETLEPLSGLRLATLRLENTAINDLSPLREMPLKLLGLSGTRVRSLEPLRETPIETLYLNFTPVSDISPLSDCYGLKKLLLPIAARDVECLHALKELDWLEYGWSPSPNPPTMTTREFWDQSNNQGHRPPLDQVVAAVEPLARDRLYGLAAEMLMESIVDIPVEDTVLPRMVACALYVADGNRKAYRREAELLLAAVSSTESPYVADQTLKACLIAPSTVGSLEVWDSLSHAVQQNHRDIEFQPWLHLSAALHSYRRAEYRQTIKHCLTLVHRQQLSMEAKVAALALQSMANRKLNAEDKAQQSLAEGQTLIAQYWPHPQRWSRASWQDWLIAQLLLDEAGDLAGLKHFVD